MVREQRGTIEELANKTKKSEEQKLKVEEYEIQLKESQIVLRDIEEQMGKII